jgi:hypothetical protein
MTYFAMGIDYSTGDRLVPPMSDDDFVQRIQEGLTRNMQEMAAQDRVATRGATFKKEIEMAPDIDVRDPRSAGWTFLVNEEDPLRREFIDVLRPLALHRGMASPETPLLFHSEDDWFEWLLDNYTPLDVSSVPHYVLVVGNPDQVPFHFQALLDVGASVGRVDLSPDDLEAYVQKIIRVETADQPTAEKLSVFFAPDYGVSADGMRDPTYYSRQYMAEPLADYVRTSLGFQTEEAMADEATKDHFVEMLNGRNPALLYTASHGMGASGAELNVAMRVNGAICCQRTGREKAQEDWLFMADDIRSDEPFLEGGVFFQFACFGYGTPAQSDFMHWLGQPELNADADFVAMLPRKLLAHPRGPIAFIGHVDTAWLHGFDDPEHPESLEPWNIRIAPFLQAVRKVLGVEPVGRAMSDMNDRYSSSNSILTTTWNRLKQGKIVTTTEFWDKLAAAFITRTDAQNYMVFGDPGAHVRIAD